MKQPAETATAELETCPNCGKQIEPVKIVYGLPTAETSERARSGAIALGGCVISADSPSWACPKCHYKFPSSWTDDDNW